MMNHAISDYFHFDHQFFHTLKPLLFKPGFLTNEYMAGRRAQYLHPVKMYIFISLVFFLLYFQQSGQVLKINHTEMNTAQLTAAVTAIKQNAYIPPQAKEEAIKDLYSDNGYIVVNNHVVKDTSAKARAKAKSEQENPHMMHTTTTDSTYALYIANQNKLPEAKRDGWMERYYNKKAFAINEQKINVKEVIEDGLKHNFAKLMFVLLPLAALILMVTFRRNKKFYVEYLIYAFHLHCFIFLFITMIMIVKFFFPPSWSPVAQLLDLVATLLIIWYIYRSLRVVYHRGRFRTVTKMIGMSLVYLFAFCICFVAFLTITVFTAV